MAGLSVKSVPPLSYGVHAVKNIIIELGHVKNSPINGKVTKECPGKSIATERDC
jgi:hypothetical protein